MILLFLLIACCPHFYHATVQNCYDGSYRVKQAPFNNCAGYRDCEPGYYCVDGVRIACPAGVYGNSSSLNSPSCSGPCPPGYFCPPGTKAPTSFVCGNNSVYCPLGSALPLPVPSGHYSIDISGSNILNDNIRVSVAQCTFGTYCENGVKRNCPAGTFGNRLGLNTSSCTGVCPEGFYCPEGTKLEYQYPCANDSSIYCPAGTDAPVSVGLGYYTVQSEESRSVGGGYTSQTICPRGSYCLGGVRSLCPAGRYGGNIQSINSSCSGICRGGYYCPAGSALSTQFQCDATDVYCPPGSPAPIPVSIGYYTTSHQGNDSTVITYSVDGNVVQGWARTAQAICTPGYFCEKGKPPVCPQSLGLLKDIASEMCGVVVAVGVRYPCPAGRYGSSAGLSTSYCDGFCRGGYYCPAASTSATQMNCGGDDVFCPTGSTAPHPVDVGYYTVGGDGNTTRAAQQRCEPGAYCIGGIRRLCLPGYYGHTQGQIIATCSGACAPGYYCPEGSIAATEVLCGDPSRYCPGNNPHPLPVPEGYYSVGGNVSSRSAVVIAPRGYYAFQGLLYACPAATYGATEGLTTAECSGRCLVPGFYCPVASISPVQRYCGDDNHYCPAGTTAPVEVDRGFYTADYALQVCPPGKWRNLTMPHVNFTDQSLPYSVINTFYPLPDCELCPEGTFKSTIGDDLALCRPCSGRNAFSSMNRIVCDCTTREGPGDMSWFNITTGMCQRYPIAEVMAYFDASSWSTNTSLTRYQQFPCEPGYFCQEGVRYLCPAGYYGNLNQETRSTCSGRCLAGYFCPPGSVSNRQYPCGAAHLICPEGSPEPTVVPAGYYTQEDLDDIHRYQQYICEPGYYCPGDGRRYPCPAGTYTSQQGTIDSQCMGPCERGHYCLAGSNSSTQYECGGAHVYCPRGSPQPRPVHDGFYCAHTGDNADEQALWDTFNRTCSIELPCEPGFYCQQGVKWPCPPGTYGWRYGLHDPACSGYVSVSVCASVWAVASVVCAHVLSVSVSV